MQTSKYTIRVELSDDVYLLYNTFAGSLAQINVDAHRSIQRALANLPPENGDTSLIADLLECGIFLPDDISEEEVIRRWYQAQRQDEGHLHLTILTTNRCNMACAYCYERDALAGAHMPAHVEEALHPWIEARLKEFHPRSFTVRFFGGEPFINPNGLLRMSRRLRAMADQLSLPLQITATTNGTHLPRPLMEELAHLGLSRLRITLDGDAALHNLRRPLKNGRPSFQQIWKNIEDVRDLFVFDIAVNAEPDSTPSIETLLPTLQKSSFSKAISGVNVKPIHHFNPDLGGLDTRVTKRVAEQVLDWSALAEQHGFSLPNPLESGPCQVHKDLHFVVDPKGDLYPCESAIGETSAVLGSIFPSVPDSSTEETGLFFKRYDPLAHPKCNSCSYFPICGGGCRLSTFTIDPEAEHDFHCPQALFERSVPDAIRKEFLHAQQNHEEGKEVNQ